VPSSILSPLNSNDRIDLDDYMFHLRDAVVLVSTKPPAPIENLEESRVEDNEEDNNITVVRILVEEEPEPILPDYDFLASKIQIYCHMWYLRRKVFVNFVLIYDIIRFLLIVTSLRLLQRLFKVYFVRF
jgi:hypothetical protein